MPQHSFPSTADFFFLNRGIWIESKYVTITVMKNIYRKLNRKHYSLGDLVQIVQSCTRDSREATAALIDLLASGRVQVLSHGSPKKVVVAHS